MNAEDWLRDVKHYVDVGDLGSLMYLYDEFKQAQTQQTEYKLNFEFLWKHAYLQAVIKKQMHIKEWLEQVYAQLPLMEQLGLKPTFNYAKYLNK